ncbi:hypothetical protein Hypma_006416 [Hypsizygus marmoreus]|uniref:Uncharacterized protein n=1 Tax=Hypsizygus marmoreus TaxID=39966 RepID=A0A369JTX5_HYPMA|nr:hypothetical protein Hypma_006416 [Hypsizygus marmoreus]
MFAFRTLLAFSTLAGALANPLEARQATNTNVAIHDIVSDLDMQIHINIPNILTMQANHSATDGTIGTQVNQLITAFTSAASALLSTPISSGSTTVRPTNDDISIIFADIMQLTSTGFSGLTPAVVPTFTAMISRLDPTVAAATNALNTALPGSVTLVHIMMLDAQQFLVKAGAWPQTLAALGF